MDLKQWVQFLPIINSPYYLKGKAHEIAKLACLYSTKGPSYLKMVIFSFTIFLHLNFFRTYIIRAIHKHCNVATAKWVPNVVFAYCRLCLWLFTLCYALPPYWIQSVYTQPCSIIVLYVTVPVELVGTVPYTRTYLHSKFSFFKSTLRLSGFYGV